MVTNQKALGQYFTPEPVVRFKIDLITKDKNASILEPSAGTGNFLKILNEKKFLNIDAYEIDDSLRNLSNTKINYENFLTLTDQKKYDVVIGNPPYTRWKNIPKETQEILTDDDILRHRLNGLMDILHAFLLKCLDRLEDNGELIFITPTFWTETLHASTIRKEMNEIGYLDTVVLLDEAKVFDNVSSTIMIFKFKKNKNKKGIKVVKIPKVKKIDEEMLNKIQSCLEQINEKRQVVDEISFFKQIAFTTNDSWKFNTSTIIKKIELIKTICKKFIPDVDVEFNKETLKIPVTDLLKNEDLKELKINKNQCFKVQYNKKWYFVKKKYFPRIKHSPIRYVRLDDIAEIGNGMVSGLDKAFQANPSTKFLEPEKNTFIKVVKAHSLEKFKTVGATPYIFVNDIEDENKLKKFKNIHKQLFQYKTELIIIEKSIGGNGFS